MVGDEPTFWIVKWSDHPGGVSSMWLGREASLGALAGILISL